MRQAGVESGIISLGGNVQTLGLKPDGSKWTVAIQDPNNTSSYVGVINVGETAVITSGESYQRNFTDTHGKFYHHILKPSTGYPVTKFARLRDDNLHGRRDGGLSVHGALHHGRDQGAQLLAHLRRV